MSNVVVKNSELHGRGCFATKPIKRGEVIGQMEVEPASRNGSHVIWVGEEGFRVKCKFRFINHADEPNTHVDGDLFVKALRRIEPDEELTFYYGDDYFD